MPFEFAFLDWLQQFHNPVLDALAVFLNYAGEHGEIWIAFTLLLLLFHRTRKAGCAMATALVLQAAKEGLNASVVFPSGIIGPGDLGKGSITNMLLSFLAGKLPLAVKGGYDFVDVRDVASGVVACAERGLPGHGYILSGHYATIRDILELVKKTVNLRHSVSYLPIGFAKLVAPIFEKISLRRREPLYFTPYSIAVLDSNGAFSRSAAATALGYTPRPLSSTIRDTVLWLKEKMGGKSKA